MSQKRAIIHLRIDITFEGRSRNAKTRNANDPSESEKTQMISAAAKRKQLEKNFAKTEKEKYEAMREEAQKRPTSDYAESRFAEEQAPKTRRGALQTAVHARFVKNPT
jgi:hypothetical protein